METKSRGYRDLIDTLDSPWTFLDSACDNICFGEGQTMPGEPKMTKVILSESLLDYRREMAEIVRQTVRENYISGVKTFSSSRLFPAQTDLLPPPKIELIEVTAYKGQIDDLILFATSDDFGITNLRIVITGDQGKLIESGDAAQFDDSSDCWDYMATASVPSGTSGDHLRGRHRLPMGSGIPQRKDKDPVNT